jgi:hypothetical protein
LISLSGWLQAVTVRVTKHNKMTLQIFIIYFYCRNNLKLTDLYVCRVLLAYFNFKIKNIYA